MVASRAIAPSWLPTVFHTRARREERSRTGPLRPTDCDCTTALSTRELSRIYKRRGKRIAFPSSRGESDKYRVTFCVILALSLSLSLSRSRAKFDYHSAGDRWPFISPSYACAVRAIPAYIRLLY